MQAGVGLLVSDVMPIYMIIALDIVITMRFSINCSTIICLPTVCFLSREKTLVKTMAPGSIFYHISFQSTFICIFTSSLYHKIPKIYLSYHTISIRSRPCKTVKGLTTPLSRWVQVFVCLCRCNYWILVCGPPTGLIPWFSTKEDTYRYFAASPFSLQEKTNAVLKR